MLMRSKVMYQGQESSEVKLGRKCNEILYQFMVVKYFHIFYIFQKNILL